MRVSGWHRLWILVSVLALVAFVLTVAATWPDEKSIPHSLAFNEKLTPTARAQITESESESKEGVRMPNGHVIYLRPGVDASRKTEVLAQYHQELQAQLQSKRTKVVLQAAALWFTTCLALIVLGHLVAWVVRGFRSSNRPANGKNAP